MTDEGRSTLRGRLLFASLRSSLFVENHDKMTFLAPADREQDPHVGRGSSSDISKLIKTSQLLPCLERDASSEAAGGKVLQGPRAGQLSLKLK